MRVLGTILSDLAEDLDISPTDYQRAVDRYGSVAAWIEGGFESGAFQFSNSAPNIYPQGSIALGTIVRPLASTDDSNYDIDLVCEFVGDPVPEALKSSVGSRLRAHGTYERMLQPEGKRCWTVQYTETQGHGFHIDVLPAIGAPNGTGLRFTLKGERGYEWGTGDPRGFSAWFRQQCQVDPRKAQAQKQRLLEKSMVTADQPLYASVDSVPDQLVRTPLQRAIQVLKRHRDVLYRNSINPKPISVIITTLAARAYSGESDVESAITNIIRTIHEHAGYLEDVYFGERLRKSGVESKLIQRRPSEDGSWEWYIPNPVNPEENFADKWHLESNARAREFFRWVAVIREDLDNLTSLTSRTRLSEALQKSFDYALREETRDQLESEFPYVKIEKDDAPKPWSRT